MPLPNQSMALLALAAATLLAGCGQAPTAATANPGASLMAPQDSTAPVAAPTLKGTSPDRTATASASSSVKVPPAPDPIALSRQTLASLASYSCTEQVYGQKNGVAVGLKLAVDWKSPADLRLEVQQTNLTQTVGSTLVFNGGSTVQLKDPSLPFFMQTLTMPVGDPRLQDGFGNRFDQATWTSVIANLTDSTATVRQIGTATVLGEPAIAYQVQNSKLTQAGLQFEQIGLDPADGRPIFIQQLDARGVASQIVFTGYAFPSVADSTRFSL
ncbi:MAG: hypothetical protein KGR26_01755 [Cyanobacteria bacterium REEB65]|nr:hypothetical protein [Cyanobacteria bacterium REEB65]